MPFTEKFTFFRKKKVGETTPVLATFSISPAASIVNGNINAVFNVSTNLTTSPTLNWDTLYETANIFIDNVTTGTVTPNGAGIGTITRQVYDDATFALRLTSGPKVLATSSNVTVQNINYTFSNVSSPFFNNASFIVNSILPVGTTVYWSLTGTNTGIFNASTGSAVVGAGGNISLPLTINPATQYYTEATIAVQLRTLSPTGRVIATSSNYVGVRSPEYFALHPSRGGYTPPANVASSPTLSNISVSISNVYRGAVLAPGGNIYAPSGNSTNSNTVLKINTTAGTTSIINLPSGTGYAGWTGGTLRTIPNTSTNEIVCAPGGSGNSGANAFLSINPINDSISIVRRSGDTSSPTRTLEIFGGGVGTCKFGGSVLTPTSNIYQTYQGNIFVAPGERNRLLVENYGSYTASPPDGDYTYEPRPFGSIGGETLTTWQNNQRTRMFLTPPFVETYGSGNVMWQGSVLRNNGNVVFIPHNSTSYVEVNPNIGTKQFVPIGGLGGQKWSGGCLGNDGSIYFAPYTSNTIYRLKADGSASSISVTAGTEKYSGAVAAPDGKIYFIPYRATSVLVYDPSSNTTSTIGTFGSEIKWWGGTLGQDGSIYCTPTGPNTPVLKINLNIGSVDAGHWMLSSYYNKY